MSKLSFFKVNYSFKVDEKKLEKSSVLLPTEIMSRKTSH